MVTRCLLFLVAVLIPAFQVIASTSCESPATASVGENTTSPGDVYTWYQFTMPQEGKLLISSEVETYVYVYSGSCGSLWYTGEGFSNLGVSSIAAGEDVFIVWYTEYITSGFGWNISIEDLNVGDHCTLASAALEGVNTVPATNNQYHWFSFQMPGEGKLVLQSQSSSSVEVFGSSCEDYINIASGYQNVTVTSLTSGEDVLIRWNTQSSRGNFDFELSVEDILIGEKCDIAVPAILGSNSIPLTNAQYYWYSYTMPADGKLVITPPFSTGFTVYTNGCENPWYLVSGSSELGITGLQSGDEIWISWYTASGGDFSWDMSVVEPEVGEYCGLPVDAAVGVNILPSTNSEYYWYKFTMPQEGKLKISSESSNSIQLLANSCDYQEWLAYGYGNLASADIGSGEEVLVRWFTNGSGGNFSWNISIEEFETGDNCEVPLEAVLGTNELTVESSQDIWYSFSMPQDGKVVLTTEAYTGMSIYKGSCTTLTYLAGGQFKAGAVDLVAGDLIYIKWDSHSGEMSWNLEVQPLEEGDKCELPATAILGNNQLPTTLVSNFWYRFTMPSVGKLVIDASLNTSFNVYSNSCESLSYQGGGNGAASILGLDAGEEIFINWYTGNSGGNFDWNLSVEAIEPGDECTGALEASLGANEIPIVSSSFRWFSYPMPADKKLTITNAGSNSINVYSGLCENLYHLTSGNGRISITDAEPGTMLFIKLATTNSNTFGGYSWDLTLEDFEQGDACALATEVNEGDNFITDVDTDFSWYHFTMPEEGKVVVESVIGANVFIYVGMCDNLVYAASGWSRATTSSIAAGEDVFIRWYRPSWNGNEPWTLSSEAMQAGETCEAPVTASSGINSLPDTNITYYWYTFTMPQDGMLFIDSETWNSVAVLGNNCDVYQELGFGYGTAGVAGMTAGQEVLIRWYAAGSSNGFDWSLSIEEAGPGEECQQAGAAVEGANEIPVVQSSYYWYTYTMPSEGKLSLSTSANTYLEVRKGNCDISTFVQGGNGVEVTSLNPGDELLIKVATNVGSNLGGITFNLAVEGYATGDICTNPQPAESGTNNLPETDLTQFWYSFVMPSSGKLSITSDSQQNITVYTNSCENRMYRGSGNGNVGIIGIEPGEQVLIVWNTYNNSQAIDWQLTVEPVGPGEICTTPVVAQVGENSLPAVNTAYYWYSFVVPQSGKMKITSTQSSSVHVLSPDCENFYWLGYGNGNLGIANVAAGQEVLIQWSTQFSGGGFDWQLSIEEEAVGDLCENSILADEGANVISTEVDQYVWYSFTMPREGKLVINSEFSSELIVYAGSCDALYQKAYAYGSVGVSDIAASEQVYIRWKGRFATGSAWELSVEEYSPGEKCDLAISAAEGSNSIAIDNLQYLWYSFTMPQSGKLVINSEHQWRSIDIFASGCDEPLYKEGGWGSHIATDIASGEEILIRWGTSGFEGEFAWDLSIEELAEGDNCMYATVAAEGANELPATTSHFYWYKFTMPRAGKLVIGADVNTQIRLYSNTCETLYYLRDDYGQVVLTDTQESEDYFIRFDTKDNGGSFNWTLNVSDFEDGESCALPVSAIEGSNYLPSTDSEYYWYSFTMPRAGKLVVNAPDKYLRIYSGTCNVLNQKASGYNQIGLIDVAPGDELLLQWDTRYDSGDFAWNLSVEDVEDGNICALAVDAFEGSNSLESSSSYHWYKFTMPREGKLTIDTDAAASHQVYTNLCENLTYLNDGYKKSTLSNLAAGTELFIRWETHIYQSFDWKISIGEIESGDRCDLAQIAAEGINTVPLEAEGSSWYAFTMPRNGKLVVRSESQNYVSIYSDCSSGSYLTSGSKFVSLPYVEESEIIYFEWSLWNEDAFEWDLTVSDQDEGDNCELATLAIEGENILLQSNSSRHWYHFTMPANKRVVINSSDGFLLQVWAGSCSSMTFRGFGDGGGSFGYIPEGEQLLIEWWADGKPLTWELILEDASEGDACSSSIEANLGENIVAETNTNLTWYHFTMPAAGKLKYSSNSSNRVSLYTGECNSTWYESAGRHDVEVSSLAVGDDVYLAIEQGTNQEGLTFMLEVADLTEGDNCEMAFAAALGINHIPATDANSQWAVFEMPEEGRLNVKTDAPFNLYKSGCGFENILYGGFQEVNLTGLVQGDQIFLQFHTNENGGDFQYTITFSPNQPGDICSDPLEAVLGINIATQQHQWFEYTVPAEGNVTVTSKPYSPGYSRVKIYDGCNATLLAEKESFNGVDATVAGLVKGQKILVFWNDDAGIRKYKWNLSFHSTVIKQNQSIDFAGLTDVRYGENVNLTASSTSGLQVAFEITSGEASIDAKVLRPTGLGQVLVKATQPGDLYYINPAEPITRSLTVLPAEILVTADNIEMVYGEAIPTLTMTLSGLVNEETQAVIETSPIAQIAETAPLAAGTYVVVPSGGSADNYTFKYVNGTLTVNKAPQSISFAPLADAVLNTGSVQLQASSTSNLPVSFAVEGPASLSENLLTFSGLGSVTVTASQAGDNNYHAAESVVHSFNIVPVPSYAISGTVSGVDGELLEGSVTATRNGGAVANTAELMDGTYTLKGLEDGSYYLRYIPGGASVELYRSTYYSGAVLASGSTTLEVSGADLSGVSWNAIAKETAPTEQGKGTITGNVIAGGNGRGVRVILGRTVEDGTPLEGITVFLLKASDNSIVNEAITDANGKFVMTGIASGSYKFHVDVPGIAMDASTSDIELDEDVPLIITAMVSEEGIVAEVSVIKGIPDNTPSIELFPNPVTDIVNIRFNGDIKGMSVRLSNLLGQEQFSAKADSESVRIDMSGLPSGVYFCTILSEEGRILKQAKLKKE